MNNDADAGSGDGGSCLASSGVDPGLGGGSPCGGRGPGSPLASRPVRGQRLGSLGGRGVSETTARMFVLCLSWGGLVVGLVSIVLEAL